VPLPSKECPTCDGTVRNIFSSICTFVSGSQAYASQCIASHFFTLLWAYTALQFRNISMLGPDVYVKYILVLQGVMGCPECKHKLQVRISADDVSCLR
jgi:hypothetical protein